MGLVSLQEHSFTTEEDLRARDYSVNFAADALITKTISFSEYFPQAYNIIEPAYGFLPNWHIDAIIEYLEAIVLGQITRLNLEVPPRYMKTNLATIAFPTWWWTISPWMRFMFVSYSSRLSTDHSVKRREIIQSNWYSKNWGSIVRIAPDQNQKIYYKNTSMGEMMATSIGGAVTGFGGDVIVIDDPINPEEAESKAERERARNFVSRSLSTRLNDKKKGIIINVAQRTHKNDVTAKLLESGNWDTLSLPAVVSMKSIVIFPISKKEIVREVGNILHEEREDEKVLTQQQRDMGTRAFMAQYNQNPSSEEAALFKSKWWRFYDEVPTGFDVIAETWDLAFKDLETSSYVAGQCIGRRNSDFFVMPREVHEHLDFPKTCKAVVDFHEENKKYSCTTILIEDKANGPGVIAMLQKKIPGVIAVPTEGSKEARASAVSPVVESGNVYLPNPYDANGNVRADRQWVLDFIAEFERFPAEPNDRVDAFSQAMIRLIMHESLEETTGDDFLDFESIANGSWNGDGTFNNLPDLAGLEEF